MNSLRDWLNDPMFRQTLYMAGIAAICIAVLIYGMVNR